MDLNLYKTLNIDPKSVYWLLVSLLAHSLREFFNGFITLHKHFWDSQTKSEKYFSNALKLMGILTNIHFWQELCFWSAIPWVYIFFIIRFPKRFLYNSSYSFRVNNDIAFACKPLFNKSPLMIDISNASIIVSNTKFKHFTFYCFLSVMNLLKGYFADCSTRAYPLYFLDK